MSIVVSELAIHPVKSFAQQRVERWTVDDFGFAGDRRWMIVNADTGQFISARSHPAMIRLNGFIVDGGLLLQGSQLSPGTDDLFVVTPSEIHREVTIWGDTCTAHDAGDSAAVWLSQLLNDNLRLVYMPESTHRQVSLKYAQPGARTGFADGFPFLIISEASLEQLNSKLADPLPMSRFRANIVVSGCEPHEEDNWQRIRIGTVEFSLVKACTRCVLTTVDPATGERSGSEPLQTLSTYRRTDKGIIFGMNAVQHSSGEIAVGMPVEIVV